MARTEVNGRQIKDQSVDLALDVTGVLPVANGGTGSNFLTLNNVLLGNGTGALQAVAPGTAGNVLTSNGTTWVSSPPTGGGGAGDVTLDGAQVLTNKTLTSPRINEILDTSGAVALSVSTTAGGNNYLQVCNALDNWVGFQAWGANATVPIYLYPKGTGQVTVYSPTGTSSLTADGTDNQVLNLVSKGTGAVQANGVPVVTTSGTQTLTDKTVSGGILSGTTTIPQSGTVNIFNTADQTTNYERTTIRWNSNAAEIGNFFGGTGSSTRPLVLGVASGAGSSVISRGLVIQNQLPYVFFGVGGSASASTAAAAALIRFGSPTAQLTAASNHQTVFSVTGNTGQTGTASYTGLLVDITETTTGSGTKHLINAQVGGTSRFSVDNAGVVSGTGLTVSSGGTASVFNTTDQTTNFEKLSLSYSGGYALVSADNGGAGAARTLRLRGGNGRRIDIGGTGITNAFVECPDGTSGANWTGFRLNSGTWTATSGVNNIIAITPTINQSSTAGYAALHINPSETATGSGVKRLISAQLGGSDRFVVDNTGLVNAVGGLQANGVAVPTISSTSTLTNKTLDLASNTITGTVDQFNAALSDGDFVTRDSNGNVTADAFISNTGSINFTANNQSLTLTADSPSVITVSASGTYSNCAINLPTSGMVPGRQFYIIGTSSIAGGCQIRVSGSGIQDFYGITGTVCTALKAAPTGPADWLLLGQISSPSSSGFLTTNANGQTLFNKTISGLNNTLSDIAQSSVTNLTTSLAEKEPTITAGTTSQYWRGDKSWATLDKSAVGLSSVDNTSDANKPVSTATQSALDGKASASHTHPQSDITNLTTDLAAKEPTITSGTTAQYWRGDKSWQTLDKSAVGLANVDNTSDASKPVSTATQTALDGKVSTTAVGAANGVASLDTNGKVPGSQLPNSIMTYQGLHDVSANDPALTDAGGSAGQVYRVSVAGSRNYGSGSISLDVGDYLIHSGTVWQKADTTDAVASVNGYTGNITLTQDDVASGTTNKVFTATEQTKLAGIATGATANSPDATLLDRANHTGTQAASTISDFSTAADARISAAVGTTVQGYDSDLAAFAGKTAPTGDVVGTSDTQTLSGKTISGASNTLSNIGLSSLSTTGTASGSTYLRGDGVWSTISNGTFADTAFTLQDDGDATKQAKFQLSGLSTETTRTYTVPDASTTLVGTDTTQTLTGKTISGSANTLTNIGLSSLSTTGTADSTTYLRGDGAWVEVSSTQASTYTAIIGDGTSTSITVTHNLNTRNVMVSVKKASDYVEVDCDVAATTVNTVTLTFATAPSLGQYFVTVVGDGLVTTNPTTNVFTDDLFTLRDNVDNTKQAQFQLSGLTTGTTRVYGLPDSSTTLVGTDTAVTLTGSQTLSNKTLTSPRVNAILDANGATNISIGSLPSAVNYFQVNNSSSGNSVNLYALGADTNISLDLNPKGTGSVTISNVPVVTTTATQSLSNKTVANPTITNYTESVVAIGTVTSAHTFNLTNGTVQTATLTASTGCTFTMPTAVAGKSFTLILRQAASTGNGTATFTGVKWTGTAPTVTATAGRMDIFSFFSDGTNWYGSVAQGYTP